MAYDQEKQIAIDAVIKAAQLCETVRKVMVPKAIEKNDKSPVTVADYGAQAVICKALAEAFPKDPVVGEEDAAELRRSEMEHVLDTVTSQVKQVLGEATPAEVLDWIDHGNGEVTSRYWTLDPIDGTKGFLRGDQYAIALAMVEDGDIKVGVLGCPYLSFDGGEQGLLFVAVRGEGTVMMPLSGGESQPLKVAAPSDTEHFRFVESVESGHGNQDLQSAIAQAAGITSRDPGTRRKFGITPPESSWWKKPVAGSLTCTANPWISLKPPAFPITRELSSATVLFKMPC